MPSATSDRLFYRLLLILVLVPLSVFRALDEIKATQRRLEQRLTELEARLGGVHGPV